MSGETKTLQKWNCLRYSIFAMLFATTSLWFIDDSCAKQTQLFENNPSNEDLSVASGKSSWCFDFQLRPALLTPQWDDESQAASLVGSASWYNPYFSDSEMIDTQTASGEYYDPDAWTGAIQIHLRDRFAGVGHGTNYEPAFALIKHGNKQIIVKINDVGPLKPGRIIDLSERAMRYFDPTLQVGILNEVQVAPVSGVGLAPGPIEQPIENWCRSHSIGIEFPMVALSYK